MMCTDKEQDGYSKILSKADCDRLKSPQKRPDVDHCEHFGFKCCLCHFLVYWNIFL